MLRRRHSSHSYSRYRPSKQWGVPNGAAAVFTVAGHAQTSVQAASAVAADGAVWPEEAVGDLAEEAVGDLAEEAVEGRI
jgi:hypothetical protein